MMASGKLVHGVGINDANYRVHHHETIAGKSRKTWVCPLYRRWESMLARCYSPAYMARSPTYRDCTVSPEWLLFSTFKEWMIDQPWNGNELDKDVLHPGNRIYSQEACVFVSRAVNGFICDSGAVRGDYPIGVSWHKHTGKLRADCKNPFNGKREYLGGFTCQVAAHEAWRRRKHEHALKLADMQKDQRVAQALRIRYLHHRENY